MGSNQQTALLALKMATYPGKGPINPSAWIDLEPLNQWIADQSIQVRIASDGTVHLRGVVSGGAGGDPCAMLPAGFAPLVDSLLIGGLTITTAGDVVPEDAGVMPLTSSTWSVF